MKLKNTVSATVVVGMLMSGVSAHAIPQEKSLAHPAVSSTSTQSFAAVPSTTDVHIPSEKLGEQPSRIASALRGMMVDSSGRPYNNSRIANSNIFALYFGASWCGPCRAENPAVVKAYKRYHDRGFDILGVSIDESKDDWMAAVKKDGLTWTQVSDLKGWETPTTAAYGIQGIPMNFLIDKEGKIIGKELRGDNLIKELQEIFP